MNKDESDEVRKEDSRRADSQFDRETKRSGVWDWTSRTISIIAIVISLVSAYITVIRRTDALSVYIPGAFPMVFMDDASGRLGITNIEEDWTLINSGTGAIAIVEEGVGVTQGESDCLKGNGILYDTPPIVIKAGDIAVQGHAKIQDAGFWTPGKTDSGSAYELLREEWGKPDEGTDITICMYFNIVTSTTITERKWLPLYTTKLKKMSNQGMLDASYNNKSNYDFKKTVPIFYHFGTIFD